MLAADSFGKNIAPIFAANIGLANGEIIHNPFADLVNHRMREIAYRIQF